MPRRTVLFAKVTREPQRRLMGEVEFFDDLMSALDPDQKVTRFGRTWRCSHPIDVGREFILGKLGFTHEGEEERTEYDETNKDFVTALATAEQTFFSHFVVEVSSEVVAFEERASLIRRQSFVGAFHSLLSESGLVTTVEPLGDPASLAEWAVTVERVTRLHALVKNPNPGWVEDAGALRELVLQTDAESVDVTVKASQGAGLNVGAPWIGGAYQQISVEGQGAMAATGMRGDQESRWTSGQRLRTDSLEEELTDDSNTIWTALIAKLKAIHDR